VPTVPSSVDGYIQARFLIESIEKDYVFGALPKSEYQILGQFLRTFNAPVSNKADGDVFGRINEYFLTQFAARQFLESLCAAKLLVFQNKIVDHHIHTSQQSAINWKRHAANVLSLV
jgi:hypothetical protein